jgi:glycosyltransferase involved in cell wall biosynthesis
MSSAQRVVAVIPAYNPKTAELAATLSSMLDQTVPVDICVIDDGSSPPVEIPDFAKGATHLVRLARNGGITVALSAGVDFAVQHGYEFLCRLDVGDLSYPDRVRRQIRALDDNPQIDLVGAFSRIIDESGKISFHQGVHGGPAAVRAYLWKNSPFRHSTFFVRVRALVDHGGYDIGFDGAEDYELLLRMAKGERVDCLPDTLIDYVNDPRGISEARRGRQLARRLKAQLRHAAPGNPAWYAGVARTVAIMIMPRGLARRATLWANRTSRADRPPVTALPVQTPPPARGSENPGR